MCGFFTIFTSLRIITHPVLALKPPRLQLAGTLSCSPHSVFLSFSLAGSRLQDRLKLSGHADLLLFLTHNALDGGRQATGVPGEDERVAVFAAAIIVQGAAGVGDGVVVVVCVNHPVVVTWLERKGEVRVRRNEGIKERC